MTKLFFPVTILLPAISAGPQAMGNVQSGVQDYNARLTVMMEQSTVRGSLRLATIIAEHLSARHCTTFDLQYVTLDPRARAKAGADEMSLSGGSCMCIYMTLYKRIHTPRQCYGHGMARHSLHKYTQTNAVVVISRG